MMRLASGVLVAGLLAWSGDAVCGEKVRFRAGVGASVGGLFCRRGPDGVLSGPDVRLGVQLTRVYGFYLDGSTFCFAGWTLIPSVRLVMSFVLFDHLELAAGPGIGYALVLRGLDTQYSWPGAGGGSSGPVFAPVGRISVMVGPRNARTGRRQGFGIAAIVSPIIAPEWETGLLLSAGLSYEAF